MFDDVMLEAPAGRYKTFWPRFCAGFVDSLVWVPLTIPIAWWSDRAAPPVLTALCVLLPAIGIAYSVVLHGFYGQTLGKMACGVKILKLDETPITMPQALVRDAPWIVLAIPGIVWGVSIAWGGGNPFRPGTRTFGESVMNGASNVWFLAEVVTMLFNAKRRALHDWIAGTVVVRT